MRASSDLEEKWFFWLSVQHLLSELIQSVLKGAAENRAIWEYKYNYVPLKGILLKRGNVFCKDVAFVITALCQDSTRSIFQTLVLDFF